MRKLIAFWCILTAFAVMMFPNVSYANKRHVHSKTVRTAHTHRGPVHSHKVAIASSSHRNPNGAVRSSDRALARNISRPQNPVACLATAVYYEARGEKASNKVNVARVVLARTHDGRFPDSVCGVIHQKVAVARGHTVCQFSWYCRPKNKTFDSEAYEKSYESAVRAIQVDQTSGPYAALYFNSIGSWNVCRYHLVEKIGHIWYLAEGPSRQCRTPRRHRANV